MSGEQLLGHKGDSATGVPCNFVEVPLNLLYDGGWSLSAVGHRKLLGKSHDIFGTRSCGCVACPRSRARPAMVNQLITCHGRVASPRLRSK